MRCFCVCERRWFGGDDVLGDEGGWKLRDKNIHARWLNTQFAMRARFSWRCRCRCRRQCRFGCCFDQFVAVQKCTVLPLKLVDPFWVSVCASVRFRLHIWQPEALKCAVIMFRSIQAVIRFIHLRVRVSYKVTIRGIIETIIIRLNELRSIIFMKLNIEISYTIIQIGVFLVRSQCGRISELFRERRFIIPLKSLGKYRKNVNDVDVITSA